MNNEGGFFKPKIITEGGVESLTPEEQKMVDLSTRFYQLEGRKRIEGERDKAPEEVELLKLAQKCLEEEFISLGLPSAVVLSEDVFHFFDDKEGSKLGTASMDNRSAVVFPEKAANTIDFMKVLLHESVHIHSHGAFIYKNGHYVKLSEAVANGRVDLIPKSAPFSSYRTGYSINNEGREGVNDHQHFKALNEGVVDKMALEITMKHIQGIYEVYKNSTEKIRVGESLNNYGQIHLVGYIVEGIAQKKGKTPEEVWETIKRGLFTGEMMFLRDIERVYGKDSLKVLDSSISEPKTEEEKEHNEDVELYFWMFNNGSDQNKRERLKERILKKIKSVESLDKSIKAIEEQVESGQNSIGDLPESIAEIKEDESARLQKLSDRFDIV